MPKYYEIDEQTARRAQEAYSMSDYKPGSATAEYRAAVDQATEIAEQHKQRDRKHGVCLAYARKRLHRCTTSTNGSSSSVEAVYACAASSEATSTSNLPASAFESASTAFSLRSFIWFSGRRD